MSKPEMKENLGCSECGCDDTVSLLKNVDNSITWCVNGHVTVHYDTPVGPRDRFVFDFHEPPIGE